MKVGKIKHENNGQEAVQKGAIVPVDGAVQPKENFSAQPDENYLNEEGNDKLSCHSDKPLKNNVPAGGIITLPSQTDNREVCAVITESGRGQLDKHSRAGKALSKKQDDKHGKYSEKNRGSERDANSEFSTFYEIARLLNTDIDSVKDECCLFQIQKLMSRLGRVIVRYNFTDAELENAAKNCEKLKVSEMLVSPAYLPPLVRAAGGKLLESLTVNALIDFPFGESTFKSKITNVKDVLKQGVDGFTVIMPAILLERDNVKILRRQMKKIARLGKNCSGVAVSALELGEDALRLFVKTAERAGVNSVTFVFGEAGIAEVKNKFEIIGKYCGGKINVKILGNVSDTEAVMELFKMGAKTIITPYADDIGKELLKRFDIKSLKLG